MRRTVSHSLTLRWLSRQSPILIALIQEAYAKELDCPIEETNDTFTDPDELDFVWCCFWREIEEAAKPTRLRITLDKAARF